MTSPEAVYKDLEAKMPTYSDYADIPIVPCNEPLVAIPDSDNLQARQIVEYMKPYTGDKVFVREGLLRKLTHAAELLSAENSHLMLDVVYGYRAPAVQQQRFSEVKKELFEKYGYVGEALTIAAHRLVSVPEVAGHPAGAAVDLQIFDSRNQKPLDFGTKIWEFKPDSYVHSPFISPEARKNRDLLQQVMTSAKIAPFDGEWWHFSDGDREAALHFQQLFAIYKQVEFRSV